MMYGHLMRHSEVAVNNQPSFNISKNCKKRQNLLKHAFLKIQMSLQMVSTHFFISSMNVLFHGKHKNGITIEILEEGRSRAQKTVKNSIFGRKKFLTNCPHHVQGEIRGNFYLYSLRIMIFWHSTPSMREMCLKKLKKG